MKSQELLHQASEAPILIGILGVILLIVIVAIISVLNAIWNQHEDY